MMNVPGTSRELDSKSAQYVKGIGPKRYEALKHLGVYTVKDLCYFFPRRYEDRTCFKPIAEIEIGEDVTICGEIVTQGIVPLKKITLYEMVVGDGTGTVPAIWFNQPFLKDQFTVGDRVILYGRTERYRNRLQLTSPEYERIQNDDESFVHVGRIVPIYALTEGLVQRPLRQALKEAVNQHAAEEIHEFLPESIRKKHGLIDLLKAVKRMHFPDSWNELDEARRRIIFDEFFTFEIALLACARHVRSHETSRPFQTTAEERARFKDTLEFELTEDQNRAVLEISKDLAKPVPMNRLLQGEVGSGKTVVAAFALFSAATSGAQAVLVAPTEILAEQHYQRIGPMLKKLEIKTLLLTGSMDQELRTYVYRCAEQGMPHVFIGTHALLQEQVNFKNLGMVVIDEQHRFGVEQRAKLVERRPRPHLLVMTATPIPRTLGLTLYGDLDITTIREQPKGRKSVKTFWVHKSREEKVLLHIRDAVTGGSEQAYILFPIIDETEKLDLQAAAQEYERLKKGIFKEVPIGLIHGRLGKKDRDQVMNDFHAEKIKVLVATSVIEVGVDNPNVTYMVIEHAERFGLSQLHQMRGRIGRGNKESMCFLFGEPTTEEGKKRLRILTKSSDGFKIAEEDLALRGPGDFFGTRQSGLVFFRIANLTRDLDILVSARGDAAQMLDEDPDLMRPEHRVLAQEIRRRQSMTEP